MGAIDTSNRVSVQTDPVFQNDPSVSVYQIHDGTVSLNIRIYVPCSPFQHDVALQCDPVVSDIQNVPVLGRQGQGQEDNSMGVQETDRNITVDDKEPVYGDDEEATSSVSVGNMRH